MYKDSLVVEELKLRFFDLEILLEWYIIYNDSFILFWFLNIIFFYKYL